MLHQYHNKKRYKTSLTLALFLLLLYPSVSEKVFELKTNSTIVDDIVSSFNLDSRVFAECGGSGGDTCTITAPDICIREQTSESKSITAVAAGGSEITYPRTFTFDSLINFTFNPSTINVNNYPTGAPNSQTANLNYTITGPAVTVTTDPGDSSGPYGGLGRQIVTQTVYVAFEEWVDPSWNEYIITQSEEFNIAVDHMNIAPIFNSMSANYSAEISTPINVPITVLFDDTESNTLDILIELSTDNFSTTLQSQTYSNVSAGDTVNHTFTNLSAGTYQWRATATETDAVGTCLDYSNAIAGVNLDTTSPTREIVLTSPGTFSPPGDAYPPGCPNEPPSAPVNVTVNSGKEKGQYSLSWTSPSDPVTTYHITYSDDPTIQRWGITDIGNVNNYTVSDLHNGPYYFWVYPVNECMPGDPGYIGTILPESGSKDLYTTSATGIVLLAIAYIIKKLAF